MDAEALERRLDLLEHRRDGVARDGGELGDVGPLVAVFRRLLPAPDRIHRRVEALHLSAGVVVVVLALHLVAGEHEEAGDRVTVSPVPRGRHGHGAGRVRRDHLDLYPLARRGGRAGSERVARVEDLPRRPREPVVRDVEIDEPGPRGLGRFDEAALDRSGRDLARKLARRLLPRWREPERDVRRVVPVARVARALELDGRADDLGELRLESGDRVVHSRAAS